MEGEKEKSCMSVVVAVPCPVVVAANAVSFNCEENEWNMMEMWYLVSQSRNRVKQTYRGRSTESELSNCIVGRFKIGKEVEISWRFGG